MEKIRGYELSKAFGIPSKEIVKVLQDYGVSNKNHMSALTEYELDVIFEYYTQKNPVADFSMYSPKPKEEEAEKPAKKTSPKKEESGVTPDAEEVAPIDISEMGRKTRTVDTRVNTVDLDRLDDEKIEELIPENVKSEGSVKKQKINQKKKQQGKPQSNKPKPEELLKQPEKKKKVEKLHVLIPDEITVGELAERMKKPATEVIKKLMLLGIMASVNETLDFDTASLIAEEMGCTFEKEIILTDEDILFNDVEDAPEDFKRRDQVVVVMGQVEHGKT